MAFMKPTTKYGVWYRVENHRGETYMIPGSCFGDQGPSLADMEMYMEGRATSAEKLEGWSACLSASGYLDSTEWIPRAFKTEAEALEEIMKLYDVDENGDEPTNDPTDE